MKHFPDGFKLVDVTIRERLYVMGAIEKAGEYDFGTDERQRNIEIIRGYVEVKSDMHIFGKNQSIQIKPNELVECWVNRPTLFLCSYGQHEEHEIFSWPIEDMELSARSYNCMKNSNIKTLGDLVQMTEEQMLDIEGFGRKSLYEVREILNNFGLWLSMTEAEVRDYPAWFEANK